MGDMAALAESMQDYGLQQPISVRTVGDRFVLTSGLRRITAARMLSWQTIPAIVRSVTANDAYLLDMIENLQREDLTPEEEAHAFRELIQARGWSVRQLAHAIKRSAAYVSKRLRVFDDPHLRQAILERGLPVSTAEELLAAPPEIREVVVEQAIAERWDQVCARQELQARAELGGSDESTADVSHAEAFDEERAQVRTGRPPGLARTIREFRQLIAHVQPSELTPSDRSAFRGLYRDLTMMARAPTTPVPRVYPPLPSRGGGGATGRQSRTRTRGA